MPPTLNLFSYFASSAFGLAAVVYLVLHAVMPRGFVFGTLSRMFMYHEAHPFQYIAIVALTYACVATAFVMRWPQLAGWRRCYAIVGIIAATILLASLPGGMLWKIHDMQAGYFPTGAGFWSDLFWGATAGLQVGWLVIALSLPYNIFGLAIGYAVTSYGFKIGAKAHPH
jgi:hypothetical protein